MFAIFVLIEDILAEVSLGSGADDSVTMDGV
jgi:hypothetical protein